MSNMAYAKRFDGHIVPDDSEYRPKALAELFCEMMADEQAAFFNMVQRLSSEWPGSAVMQWRCMESHINPKAREMLKDMFDHTGEDQ